MRLLRLSPLTLLSRLLTTSFCGAALLVAAFSEQPAAAADVDAGEAHWIWAGGSEPGRVPRGASYFRRSFQLQHPESGRVEITCDDRYELIVNGRRVGTGSNWRVLDAFDITKLLAPGRNTIAIRAENSQGATAGLVARVSVREIGHTAISYSTDESWKVSAREYPNWQMPRFNDSAWAAAVSRGELGYAEPWGDQIRSANGANPTRFKIAAEFRVERVTHPKYTGSLIAMAFNEMGEILAGREGGPLILIRDKNRDGVPESVETYCEQIKNCQGILPLNGQVFCVGEGPDGAGFYCATDEDRNRKAEQVKLLFKFVGGMNEHGPHAPVLGPDGLVYLVVGNRGRAEPEAAKSSPYHHYYEGDLVQPRYEDVDGETEPVKAPGGVILRTDISGSSVELFAGGLRNAYDIAFNRDGELFTFDSDMEWDEGTSWYRGTRIEHVIAGAEFGWRSGWAKIPDYCLDTLPPSLDLGRGSPTGLEFYDHYRFPPQYQGALFACDWSLGRILAIRLEPDGATYTADAEVFLQGRPLNVTDIAVGPDGWLYFTTGGRGTEGGVYRIVWTGRTPARPELKGVMRAIRQPQLTSAWSRNYVAAIKQEMGAQWARELASVVDNPRFPVGDRTRALDLMQLVGPFPAKKLLVKLSADQRPEIRAKAADLMGIHADDSTNARLVELLRDPQPLVRRRACEALVRVDHSAPAEALLPLLADQDRWVAWSARRAVQQLSLDDWQPLVLGSKSPGVFVAGAAAILALEPDRPTIDTILEQSRELMQGFLTDNDFIGMLRVVELTLIQGKIQGTEVPELGPQLAEEYPSSHQDMNRELVKLLAYLQAPAAMERMLTELNGDAPQIERLHLGLYLRFLRDGWTLERKLDVLRFYETARTWPGGNSIGRYLDNVSGDFLAGASPEELREVLARGAELPNGALFALMGLAESTTPEDLRVLQALDGEIAGSTAPGAARLATGIVAILGHSRDPAAMAYLRAEFETHPERRSDLAMGLAQSPGGDNWPVLIRALPILEGDAAGEVITQLMQADEKPDQAEPIRQAILAGLRLGDEGGTDAVKLLEKWTGQSLSESDDELSVALEAWQEWFTQTYPDAGEPRLPEDAEGSKWSYEQLLAFVESPEGLEGDLRRGAAVFEKAQCIKCHRHGSQGEAIGPDLTTAGQRFQRREILESVLFPSHAISDQYSSRTIVTTDGRTLTGIVAPAGQDATVILQPTGAKATVRNDDIAENVPSKQSAMPEGLFNTLSLEEIADLMAFLSRPPSDVAAQPSRSR